MKSWGECSRNRAAIGQGWAYGRAFGIISYSEQELECLLLDLESELVERKGSWGGSASEKGKEAVCAFANDLANHCRPGLLIVGANDDGHPSGLTMSDRLLLQLADIRSDGQTLPPPSLSVRKVGLAGADMAVVEVMPSDSPPVRYKGKIWVRVGPSVRWANPSDERILNEKRRFKDLPFDLQPLASCSVSELDRGFFENEYLPQAFDREVLLANGRGYDERLASCRMIGSLETPNPTVLGMLVLGKRPRDWIPGSYVQFLRLNGDSLSDEIIDAVDIDGPLAQIIRRLDEKLDSHNRVAVDLTGGDLERRSHDYPKVALQQLTRNALMHRGYENTNAPVRINWFNDRIEILNPGGPFGLVTREHFGRPGLADYRNPGLADAMRVQGFVQRFGVGIATARRELEKNGNPPLEFGVTDNYVMATVWRAR